MCIVLKYQLLYTSLSFNYSDTLKRKTALDERKWDKEELKPGIKIQVYNPSYLGE